MAGIVLPYDRARVQIREADVLILRGSGLISHAIGVAGRSEASHAGVIGRAYGRWFVLQQTAFGQKRPLLSDLVLHHPGRVDIYRRPGLGWQERAAICRAAMDLASEPYGWQDLLCTACYHLPVVRWFTDRRAGDDARQECRPRFCAALVATAFRSIGCDLVPSLPDWRTEPADLTRSGLLGYTFTLTWPHGEASYR